MDRLIKTLKNNPESEIENSSEGIKRLYYGTEYKSHKKWKVDTMQEVIDHPHLFLKFHVEYAKAYKEVPKKVRDQYYEETFSIRRKIISDLYYENLKKGLDKYESYQKALTDSVPINKKKTRYLAYKYFKGTKHLELHNRYLKNRRARDKRKFGK